MLGWTPNTYDAHNSLFNLLGTRNGTRGVFNDGGWSNPKFDDLLDKIAVETDAAKRQARSSRPPRSPRTTSRPSRCTSRSWSGPRANIDLVQLADNSLPAALRDGEVRAIPPSTADVDGGT